MKTDIQSIGFEASQGLTDAVHKKLKEFQKYYSRITGADVYLKDTNRTEEGKNKSIDIRVFIPGEDIHATADGENFHAALAGVADKIVRQLRKRNQIQKEKR